MRAVVGHIVTRDRVRIGYRSLGQGRPLLCCNGLGVPRYYWQALAATLAPHYRVISWDYRGQGDSSSPPNPWDFSHDDFIADGLALIEALDLEGIVAIGHSVGFQIAVGLAARCPRRFAGLVSCLGTAGRPLDHFLDSPAHRVWFNVYYLASVFYAPWVRRGLDLLLRTPLPGWIATQLRIFDDTPATHRAMRRYFEYAGSLHPLYFATLVQAAQAHDARPLLRELTLPVLLVAGTADRFAPRVVAEEMERLARAPTVEWLDGGTHAALMDRPQDVTRALQRFLRAQAW